MRPIASKNVSFLRCETKGSKHGRPTVMSNNLDGTATVRATKKRTISLVHDFSSFSAFQHSTRPPSPLDSSLAARLWPALQQGYGLPCCWIAPSLK